MCLSLGLTRGQHSGFVHGPVLTLLGGAVIMAIITLALILSLWAWRQDQRSADAVRPD